MVLVVQGLGASGRQVEWEREVRTEMKERKVHYRKEGDTPHPRGMRGLIIEIVQVDWISLRLISFVLVALCQPVCGLTIQVTGLRGSSLVYRLTVYWDALPFVVEE